jgi:hypothetical protein
VTKEQTKKSAPGPLTHVVIYAVSLVAMYFAITPEITENFTENQMRSFRVAAVSLSETAPKAKYAAYSLAAVQAQPRKIDLASMSFLLPQDVTNIFPDSGDTNKVTVLERHPDWQLVEYDFGNTYSSISRYRAFKDRIEPVSYRMTMSPGIMFYSIALLIPVWIVSAVINAIWNAVVGKKKSHDAS